MKFKLVSVLFAVLFMVGCASGPSYMEYAATIPPIADGSGRVYVYRTATVGAAVQPGVKIGDEVVGKAVPKGFFYVDLPAGDYVISASTEAKRSLSFGLEASEEKYVRLEVKMGVFSGHIKPVLVEPSVGEEDITKTKYIGN